MEKHTGFGRQLCLLLYFPMLLSIGFEDRPNWCTGSGCTTIGYMSLETHLKYSGFLFYLLYWWLYFQIRMSYNSLYLNSLNLWTWDSEALWAGSRSVLKPVGVWATAVGPIIKKVGALVSLGCHKKFHRLGDLNSRFIFSQFWRLEVQGQGASMVNFWWGYPLWLLDGCHFSVLS